MDRGHARASRALNSPCAMRLPPYARGLPREGERMRFAFVLAEKAVWPIKVVWEVLDVSRSGYYA